MKRILAVFLLLLLLAGCSAVGMQPTPSPAETPSAQTETPAAGTEGPAPGPADTEPAAPETDAPDISGLSGMEALQSGDCLLFFRVDQLQDNELPPEHRGDAVTLEELHAWHEAQANLPRTHYYDDAFAELPLLQEMMDYVLSEGYAGVTLPVALLDLMEVTEDQWLKLYWTYRIDEAQMYYCAFPDSDGNDWCTSVWYGCENPESVERFHTALEKAREIVAEIPEGLDEYDRAQYLYTWLKKNVKYDTLGLSYYSYDWFFLYDALIDGTCVCTGFSDALYYLYSLAGIDCVCLVGFVEESDFNAAAFHQWNAAKLYGNWYCFDVTWDTTTLMYKNENTFFAVSKDMMDGVSRRTYSYESLFPVCSAGFRPPEEWNETPEGALRAYLWLREYCLGTMARSYLIQTDQLRYYDSPLKTLSGRYMVYDMDYSEVVDSFMPYITQLCYRKNFENSCFRDEDGKLAVHAGSGGTARYRIESCSGEGGSCTAQLISDKGARATAVFTVVMEDGRYKVNTVTIKDN